MKKLKGLTLLGISALLLGACGTNNESASSKSGGSDDPIIIYSNAASDGRGDYFVDAAAEAGFNIEFVELGGTDLINRLVAEKDAPIADVVFGLNQMNFDTLRQEELLEAYEPAWAGDIDPSIEVAEDQLYHPIDIARVFPIYNADIIDEADVPTDWSDFYADSKYHGQYRVQTGLGGATDTAAMYIHLINHRDEDGEMGVSQEGWDNLTAWFDNGYATPESEDWVQNFVDGKVPYSFTFMSNVGTIEEEYGVNVGIINPESGVIQTVEQIGVVADGEDNSQEQALIDWFGSEEVMEGFAAEHNQMPANKNAQDAAPESLTKVMDATTPADIDFQWVNEWVNEWVEFAELNIL
ncbi:extracellular solute-binding protein [Carnobacterium sp. PL17GRE32]|uniref:extracellular solute-binding protein n=1 Tax=Lactobacillales TaxID=186826 RepID=UPI0011ED4B77|nr:extracellular solute-binding protein [Carnobacterium sp. PL17GRE32]KAF3300687.1 extracellular solute-binding protein [Carnobacterium sp. PL17RED31]KAF3304493.1 extracellular solute-binding protein [Carnobacterium sp. PL17GRE32]